ncbi:MAG: hypothetical protein SFV18_03785 [Bryobacteraceae bacterium]|nr:hypothetical protein [Bryobacteraceae bacterium]
MGFALWVLDDVAWAAGTHEYKPMGAAVIGAKGQFRARDFSSRRKAPRRSVEGFHGLFASLEDVNRYLQSQPLRKNKRPISQRVLPTI